jgi:peroxiredoxin
MIRVLKVIFILFACSSFSFKGEPYKETKHVGKSIPDFSLRNIDSNRISFKTFPNAKGFIVVFTCNHCPFAKLYPARLNALNLKYSSLGVPLLAINSMDTAVYEDESLELMRAKAMREKTNFPYLYDVTQSVGKSFGADHTPHAFILWKENEQWIIKYAGAIDDNGEHPELANSYIENALTELLANKAISNAETASFGCRIYYRK